MNYSERSYFDREPCAHVALWFERQRLIAIRDASLAAIERMIK